ncbi:sulfurtransferase complex subunit TusD [Paraglaciecola aquimarina]|uniref:Sulfurtransferase complex subunit TusD n=1 Tax=Paraglaciecola aquimarina TaxID=1235557 RepID=A0ABU3SYB7_9ALTE|nr:sulfurtransferase complex subunit TusD [Paraglaciecola aquimarina]MDU0354993.1 sulfurtransferase complex subunit TusD [Paraglaciecola aquimarina]
MFFYGTFALSISLKITLFNTMALFTILVTSAPHSQQNAYTAYRFTKAALAAKHQVNGIFFYGNGTLNGSALQVISAAEFNLHQAWVELAIEYAVPLMVCVTAASKRGITSQQDAQESDQQHYSLSTHFESVGLGELATLISQSDRLVQF